MGAAQYIRYDAPGVEVEQPGEQEKIREVSEQFNRLQMMSFKDHMHCLRGTHLKTHGCVVGKFIVYDNLPTYLAQGLFARPGTYDCILRYSSLTPKLLPDSVPQPRGIGIKVFGVAGDKIWGEDRGTQDFTLNNYPVLELRTPQATCEIIDSLERNWDALECFAAELGARKDAELATLPARLPRQHLVAMPEYSQSAYRHGSYVAKYAVFPASPAQRSLADTFLPADAPVDALSQHAREFHAQNTVTYSFHAQMLRDLSKQPVDDIGIEWDAQEFPWEEMGRLEFAPQDAGIPAFRVWWDDRITLNPWHGLVEHTPLGSANRMRRVVYAESRKLRLRVNAHENYVEPAGLEDLPIPVPIQT